MPLPDRAICRRSVFTRFRDVPQQFPRGDPAVGDLTPRSIVPHDGRSGRADQRRRRHGRSGRRRSARGTISAPAPTGAGWMATARRMATTAPGPSATGAECVLTLERDLGRHPAQPRRVRPGHLHAARRSWRSRSARASIAGGTTTRTISRPMSPSGMPTANNRLLPDQRRHRRQPARRRAVSPDRSGDRVGRLSSGFRAPTLNELYRQFRVGAVLTLANDQLGPERLVGGEAGINIAPARSSPVRTTWFDNRVKNPVVERHADA